MSNFAEYAQYYDLFYQDKDYAGEASFVADLLRAHAPAAQTILELGCGTGRHAVEFVRKGYAVSGIDQSSDMVMRARETATRLPVQLRTRFTARQGDVTCLGNVGTHDAAISLFHVVNYQTTNSALLNMFSGVSNALRPGGVFMFDFWYGPAVLSDQPKVRIRRAKTPAVQVIRLAEPIVDVNRNAVDVHYTLLVTDRQTGQCREFTETHSMRYLFLPEIEVLAANAGLLLLGSGAWLTHDTLSDRTWLGWAVVGKHA